MNNSNSQTARLWAYLQQHPNEMLDMPTLNRVCAGPDGVFCASWTRRASSVRKLAQAQGGSFEKVRDEWVKTPDGGKRRETAYRYAPGKPFGYICPSCNESIYDSQPTEHTKDGLTHTSCCLTP